jgi:hypothetical protein
MTSTQAVISSASPTRTPANELLPVQQLQTDTKESLYQLPVQRKLSVGAADDPLEKEADDMADKVMRMPNPEPISFSTSKSVINRKCSECEKEEELQRKESNGETVSAVPSIVQNVLSSPGRSLDTDTRSFMAPRFNYDFSNVKIHDNELAAKSASSINALAYTSGNNVVFNSGQYNTNTDPGKRLLAHELTHVVQQNGPGIQRQEAATPVTSQENQTGKFIVEDNMTPGAGQMRKSDFLERLNVEVCATVDQALQGSMFSSDNCPYIRAAFARYQNSTPVQLEQTIARYEPSTRTAQSAEGLIQLMKIRVSAAATRWLQTGDLSDLPEEIRSQIPTGLGVMSSIVSTISTITSAIGSVFSSIGSLFFKERPGGAQSVQSPVSVMQSLGNGNSIDGSTRGKMENAFETNFSNVEIHTDSNATRLSNEMNARAFTVGNHIAFGSSEYKPGTMVGDALMAHELAHVVQQGKGMTNELQPKDASGYGQLEEDADNSAIGAMVSIHQGKNGSLKEMAQRATPKMKSGLSLSRCSSKVPHTACTAPELTTINTSKALASNWVSSALVKLRATPIRADVTAALQRNFGATDGVAANLPDIITRIVTAEAEMNSAAVYCGGTENTDCANNHCGFSYAGVHEFLICRNITLTSSDTIFQAYCPLHESFHTAFSNFTVDSYSGWGGHWNASSGYPGSNPLRNADSYVSLILDLK